MLAATILFLTGAQPARAQPGPHIEASPQQNHISAIEFGGGALLTFTIRQSAGGTILFTGDRTADPTGNAFIGFFEHGVDLVPGNSVEVTDGTTPKQLTLENLAITNVNRTNDVVSGTADPSEPTIQVDAFKPPSSGASTTTAANASGNWSANFAALPVPFDLDGQTGVSARITDGEGDATLAGLGPPTINASLSFDNIFLNGFDPGVAVSLSISGTPGFGPQDVTPDAQGSVFVDRSLHGVDIVPGTVVNATQAGGNAKSLTAANLSITTVDAGLDDVTGTGPPSAEVHVNVNTPGGGGAFLPVTASGGGAWTADFSGIHDITSGTFASAGVRDPDGDNTSVEKQPPFISAGISGDFINLHNFTPGVAVSLTITPGFGPQNFTPDAQGNVFVDRSVTNVDLVPGLVVDATQSGVTKSLTIANLSVTTIDPGLDDVSGTAPPGAQVHVNVNEAGPECCGVSKQVTASDPGGTWTADFSGLFDVTGGTAVHASVNDADGDMTSVDTFPPSIEGNLTFDSISGGGFTPDASVNVDIRSAPGAEPPLFSGTAFTDGFGSFWMDREVHGQDLQPGMEITVTGSTKVLELADLTIDTVDLGTDVVTGTAPPGSLVEVSAFDNDDPESGEQLFVEASDPGGTWTANFATKFDIDGGTSVHARVNDGDGDRTFVQRDPSMIEASLTYDWIGGESFTPSTTVEIDIRSAPGADPPLFSGSAGVDEFGGFFLDGEQHGRDLQPGMEITVTGSTKVLELADLTIAAVDLGDNTVSGTATPGAPVQINLEDPDFDPQDDASTEVTADSVTGAWSVDFDGVGPGFDIDFETFVQARVADDDGDRTVVERNPPTITAEIDFDGVNGQGFTPNSAVAVDIRSAPGVNPPLFSGTVPTDGGGSFELEPFDHNVDLLPGMEIIVTGSTKVLLLVELTVNPIDPASNVVSGTTAPGKTVDVQVFGPAGDTFASPVADSKGKWTATFPGYDFVGGFSGTQISVSVADDDGDRVQLDERRPASIQWASLTSDEVCPGGFGPGVTVTINDAGGRRLWRGPVPGGPEGCVPRDVHGQDLVPGMIVSATDGTITANLTLVPLTIDSVDGNGMVSGTASPGADVRLTTRGPFGDTGDVIVSADTAGEWTADLSVLGFEVGEEAWAIVSDGDGDGTQASRQPPNIDADLTLDTVEGCGFALESSVTVSIDAFTSGPVPTDGGGCFAFDATAQNLVAGNVVSVSDGTRTRELTLAVLTMNVNVGTGIVSGTATPGTQVDVGFAVVDCECGDGLTVEADGSGNWSADFSGEESLDRFEIRASVNDADDDGTHVSWFADVRFSQAEYTVPEGAGNVTITVQRIGTAHVEVGVSHATSDGSATAGADYTATAGTIAFADGVTSQTFTVPIVNDGAVEGDEVLNLALSDPTGGAALAPPITATITIQDDDGVPATLAFSSATYSVGEGGPRATITVQRSGGTSSAVGVAYATSDGTATAGADYTANTGTLSFAAGETVKTFDVRISEDSLFEGDETLNLTLSSPTGGAVLGTPSGATLTIVENELPPTLQFAQAGYSVAENGGSVTLTVTRAGPTGNALSVDYVLVPGSATNGSDFTFTPGTLTFGKSETSETITIPITDDADEEPAEDFTVQLVSPSGAGLGSPSEATVEIGPSDQQPDVLVGPTSSSGFIGDDVYNTTGSGQTLSVNGARQAKSIVYFRIQNDGNAENTVVVAGGGTPTHTILRYFLGTTDSDISGPVSGRTYQVTLAPGEYVVIRAELTISGRVKVGQTKPISLTATWTGDSVQQDKAIANVNVAS